MIIRIRRDDTTWIWKLSLSIRLSEWQFCCIMLCNSTLRVCLFWCIMLCNRLLSFVSWEYIFSKLKTMKNYGKNYRDNCRRRRLLLFLMIMRVLQEWLTFIQLTPSSWTNWPNELSSRLLTNPYKQLITEWHLSTFYNDKCPCYTIKKLMEPYKVSSHSLSSLFGSFLLNAILYTIFNYRLNFPFLSLLWC